jgi:hypothetical protein
MSEPLRVGSDYWPVWACTYAGSRPIGPAALDCVRVIVIRSGSALLVGELGQRLVKTGDVVLLAANVLCGSEPEGHITLTTIHGAMIRTCGSVLGGVAWSRRTFPGMI